VWSRHARLALLLVGIATLAAASAGEKGPPRREVYPAQFPDGAGRPLAERYCAICHAPTLVTQQAKDSTGWEKTLAQMEKWGIRPTPAEHDSLRDYLVSHFGPRAR
jgi:cytochrome c5